MLTVVDQFSRQTPFEPRFFPGRDVVAALTKPSYGQAHRYRSRWITVRKVHVQSVRSGPISAACSTSSIRETYGERHIESFNVDCEMSVERHAVHVDRGRVRQDRSSADGLQCARPHSSLGNLTPIEFASKRQYNGPCVQRIF